jgi:hypothetical protein
MARSIHATSKSELSPSATTGVSAGEGAWLFSRNVDLAVFGGSAVVALVLLALGVSTGLVERDTPDWTWVPAVLLVDVAHVYSTGVRIYLDPSELRRRPMLYTLIPLGALGGALVLVAFGEQLFWRALAYLAVFHFVRQQYGWVALYRRKAGETDRVGKWIDAATIYAATLYPLAYWHANLPRRFWWFLEGDFVTGISKAVAGALEPAYWTILVVYIGRSLWKWLVLQKPNPGKDLVVATTAACWYLGIVAFNSDYAFTVTNVLIHGVPYIALVYYSGTRRSAAGAFGPVRRIFAFGVVPFLLTLWALAYVEELLWHRFVWWDREWLFGGALDAGPLRPAIIALLAIPQIVHYVLDGFIWRRGQARYL